MQFNLTITYQQQQINVTVKRAVYFDKMVYQIDADNLHALIYMENEKWKAVSNDLIHPELVNIIGEAIFTETNHDRYYKI